MHVTISTFHHFPKDEDHLSMVQQLRPHLMTLKEAETAMEGMEKEDCIFWVATDENSNPLGYISFRRVYNSYLHSFCLVDDMIVLEPHRGKGIGTLLMKEVEKKCREEGIKTIKLDSGLQRSQTHLFYEKQGFNKKCYTFEKSL